MKSTGIVRKVDELGRIVLPIELRRTLDIAERDALEIYVDGSTVVLKKYRPCCIFCDSSRDLMVYKDKNICPKCLKDLKKRLKTAQKNAPRHMAGSVFCVPDGTQIRDKSEKRKTSVCRHRRHNWHYMRGNWARPRRVRGADAKSYSSLRGRGTFGRCPKRDQKDNQKPRFLDFLRAKGNAKT